MNSTISSTKTRISKKSMTALPAAVAEAVRDIQEGHPNIKSFIFHAVTPSHEFRPWENETWTVVMADDQRSIETAAEHRMGASGQYDFGGAFKAPVGAFVLRISYYTRYFLDIYNVQPAPLEAPEPVIESEIEVAEEICAMSNMSIEQNAMRYAQAIVSQMQYERVPAMMQYEAARKPQALVVESVIIGWSESNQCDGPQTFASLAAADALLRRWAIHAPKNGAYDKTNFKVTFTDGSVYDGRFDLQYQHSMKRDLIKAQMVEMVRYAANNPHGLFPAEDVKEYNEALPLYEAIDRGTIS